MLNILNGLIAKLNGGNKDLSSRIGLNFIIKFFGLFLGYLNILIISNWYGVSAYGLFTLSFTIISIAHIIPKFGLENAILRLINEFDFSKKGEIKNIIIKSFVIALILGLLFSFLLNYLAPFLAEFLKNDWLIDNVKILSYVLIPFSFLFLNGAVLQALNFTKEHMFIKTMLLQVLFLISLIVNYIFRFDFGIIELYAISILLGFFISSVILTFILWRTKTLSGYVTISSNVVTYRRIINTSFPMLMASSMYLIMGWTDILMLGYFLDEKQVGIFNAALRLSTLTGISLVVVNSVVTHKFSALYLSNKLEELKELVYVSTRFIFYLVAPVLFIFLLFPKFILSLLGEEFINGKEVLIILTIGQTINALCGSVGLLMLMTNQEKRNKNIIMGATMLNVILNYILIPIFGIKGAAIANTISLIFWNIIMVVVVKKKLGFWTFYIPFLFRK